VQAATAGDYTMVVFNSFGSDVSQIGRIIIGLPPFFIRQPERQTVVQGDTVQFSVEMGGAPPFGYRWRRSSSTLVDFGAGRPVFTITNVQPANAGSYSVVVTNIINAAPGVLSAFAQLTVLADTDGDHVPDTWETANGFDPADPADGALDADGDGLSNHDEYRSGTDPRDPDSYMKLDSIGLAEGGILIEFKAMSNRTYSVLMKPTATPGAWSRLADVPSATSNRTVTVTDPNPDDSNRYYQLITPRLP
jgi:hypothetical protein